VEDFTFLVATFPEDAFLAGISFLTTGFFATGFLAAGLGAAGFEDLCVPVTFLADTFLVAAFPPDGRVALVAFLATFFWVAMGLTFFVN
jgi:hypothetical protein